MTTIELVEFLLARARGASEVEDARTPLPVAPMPVLTDDQCAAVDDMAGLS
jgi:hypothetical protein